MHRHRDALGVLAEMNLTNMVDTAFTLLIAFMLVSPSLKHSIQIDLPKVSHHEAQSTAHTVTIVIDKAPEAGFEEPIYLDDQRVDVATLRAAIEAKQTRYKQLDIVVEADAQSTYETFARVMGLLKSMEIEGVGLITEPLNPTE